MLEVLESFVLGKRGDEATCEDAVVSTPHHVAVIDGATTEAGHEIEGKAPGRFTMETLSAAIRALAPDAEPAPAIGELSRALAAALREHGAEPGSLASACVLIASAQRREIWRVGNSVFTVDGTVHPQRWALVEIPARMRSAYLRALLRAKETTPDQIARNDPGQALIAPLLRAEHVFRNARDAGELTYTAIDGGEIPEELIEVGPLPGGADVVFASDGYPLAASTLAEAEEYLRASLAEDPLRIHRHPEVRGVRDGWVSYDDRAYVRFRLRA